MIRLDAGGRAWPSIGRVALHSGYFEQPRNCPVRPNFTDHRRAALVAGLRRGDLHPLHPALGGLQRVLERVVELVEDLDHVLLGVGDVVELVLHVRGELQVEDLGEVLDQQVGDHHPQARSRRTGAPSARRTGGPGSSG
jgi:hypothetical protein